MTTTTLPDQPGDLLGYADQAPATSATPTPGPAAGEAVGPDVEPAFEALADRAQAILRSVLDEVTGLRGALVASVDGRPVAAVLPHHDPGSTAAIVAASLGLGSRLADLSGDGRLQEIVVRSGSGYVVIYSVGERGVLTVLTSAGANLALLHLRARQACTDLADLLEPGS